MNDKNFCLIEETQYLDGTTKISFGQFYETREEACREGAELLKSRLTGIGSSDGVSWQIHTSEKAIEKLEAYLRGFVGADGHGYGINGINAHVWSDPDGIHAIYKAPNLTIVIVDVAYDDATHDPEETVLIEDAQAEFRRKVDVIALDIERCRYGDGSERTRELQKDLALFDSAAKSL